MLIVIAILNIKFVRKTKLQSVSAQEHSTNDTATSSHSSALRKDLSIEMDTIYQFVENTEKEMPMRFTPWHLMHFADN